MSLKDETLIPIADAIQYFTVPPTVATVWRWCIDGVSGVRLEHARSTGSRLFTSEDAVRRFEIARAEARANALSRRHQRPRRVRASVSSNHEHASARMRAEGF